MCRRIFIVSLVFAFLGGIAGPAPAVEAVRTAASVSTPPLFYKTYAGPSFSSIRSEIGYAASGPTVYANTTYPTGMPFIAPIDLPQGAQIYTLEYYVIDNSPTAKVDCMLGWYVPETDMISTGYGGSTSIIGASPDVQTVTHTFSVPFTVNDTSTFHYIEIILNDTFVQSIAGARVGYTVPSPAPSGAQVKTLGGWAFRPDTSDMKYASSGGLIYLSPKVVSYPLVVRLNLPVGANIYGLTFYVVDADPAAGMDLDVGLSVYSASSPADTWDSFISSSGLSASWGVMPLVLPGVNVTVKAGYSYTLMIKFGGAVDSLCLAGVRVDYTLPPGAPTYTSTSYSGMNLQPTSSLTGFSALGSELYQAAPSAGQGFNFLLDLPQGAYVRKITCYAVDNDDAADHNVECSLAAYHPVGANFAFFYSVSSDTFPISTAVRSLKLMEPWVDTPDQIENGVYQYAVFVTFHTSNTPNVKMVGVTVETGWQMFLPALKR